MDMLRFLYVCTVALGFIAGAGCNASDDASAGPVRDSTPSQHTPPTPVDSIALMTDGGRITIPAVRQRILIREDSLWEEALRIHYNAIVLDGHIDTPMLMLDRGYNFLERHRASHVDLPRMIDGGLDGAFFSIYVAPPYGEGERAVQRARDMIAEVKRQVALSDSLELATSANDVRRITRAGRKAVLMGIEGGHALAGSPEVLREMRDLGIRYVTLTHINSNSLADASQAAARWNGLSDRGAHMIREMNRLGVLVDLSHASDATFYDAIRVSQAPVMLSHSSVDHLSPNVRNVDDAMLRALAENGGIIMINFFDAVVNPHLTEEFYEEVYSRLPVPDLHNLWSVVYEVKREMGLPGSTLDDVLDHIDHAVKVAGIDHVGLGSDFDGVFDLPAGLQDVTRLPWLTYGLLKRGYSEEEVYKLLGGNALRVMEEAEHVAARMRETDI